MAPDPLRPLAPRSSVEEERHDEALLQMLNMAQVDRMAQDVVAKEAVQRWRTLTHPKVSPSRQARQRRVYLASVMDLDRHDDLLRSLREGMNPNATGPQRLSLLAAACARGSLRAVQALLAAGADPNRTGAVAPGLAIYTPMEHLLRVDHRLRIDVGKLQALLDAGAEPNTMGPLAFHRPLATVLQRSLSGTLGNNARKALYLLLDHGADPRAPCRDGRPTYAGAGPRLQAAMLQRHRAWEAQALAQAVNEVWTGPVGRPRSRL